MRISQSLIKDYRDYQKGLECGIVFEAKHISRSIKIEPSDAMLMGQLFEYLGTGERSRDMKGKKLGQFFANGLMKAGLNGIDYWDELLDKPINMVEFDDWDLVNKHWAAPWRNVWIQAKHYQDVLDHYGITQQEKGLKLEHEEDGTTYVIVLDVYGPMTKYVHPDTGEKVLDEVMIDTKMTGNINNKWEDYGWADESLEFKDKLMVQPMFYTLFWQKKYGKKIPFFFFVHANNSPVNRKIIQVNVGPGCLEELQEEIDKMLEAIDFLNDVGYKAHPRVDRCYDCPLKEGCEWRADHPRIQSITLL